MTGTTITLDIEADDTIQNSKPKIQGKSVIVSSIQKESILHLGLNKEEYLNKLKIIES